MRLSKSSVAFLPVVAALSEQAANCVRDRADDLAYASHCGDAAALSRCLVSLSEASIQSDIEQCLLDAGCGADESAVDATAFIYLCDNDASWANAKDLRKRQRGGNSNNNNADAEDAAAEEDNNSNKPNNNEDTNTKGNANTKANTPAQPAPTQPAAPQQTPEDTPAATTPAAAETTPERQTEVVRVTAAAQTVSGGIAKPSQGTECYATRTATESICDPTGTCEERVIEKVRCLDGFLCRMDSKGQTTCMEKVNKLDTGGIIVSIIFAAAIVISIGMMTFFCCKDKSQQKKLAAKAEAAAIAKASSAGTRARNVSDRQPLMTSQPNPQAYGDAPSPSATPQPDPFNDQHRY